MSPTWVFDLDDTLYLERDFVKSGFRAVDDWAQRELDVRRVFDTAWGLFEGGTRGTTLTDAFDALGRPLTAEETSAAVRLYRTHSADIRLCADAADLLSRLSNDGVRHGILTDGPADCQRAKLHALGLNSRHCLVAVTDEHGPAWHKPNTAAFAHLQSALGTTAVECTYIADNPRKDFLGPKRLGWRTVRIVRRLGLHAHIDSTPGEVDITIDSLDELSYELERR